ncbi:MAG: glutamine amidotransferase, partial [Candidatus Nitrosothermus koennekii]
IILSGRVRNNKIVNVKNISIVRYCYLHNIPLLGICYGAEIIALALGGTIKRLDKKIHGLNDVIINDHKFIDKRRIRVFESHSYVISRLPKGFRSIGYSNNSRNEIITNGIIIGTQFHPELTEDGRELIANFLNRKSIIP